MSDIKNLFRDQRSSIQQIEKAITLNSPSSKNIPQIILNSVVSTLPTNPSENEPKTQTETVSLPKVKILKKKSCSVIIRALDLPEALPSLEPAIISQLPSKKMQLAQISLSNAVSDNPSI